MSGHSKWSKIKRQKGVADVKKGKIFSQLSKAVTLAAKDGGGDASMNPALKLAVEKAKQANMPLDNIEKAIKKGTGELEGGTIEEVLYEAYGPEGIALIIEGTTDNTNRTVAEIKHILSKNGGRLGEVGSVKWMFERFGYIEIDKKQTELADDDLEMAIIDSGAEDFDALTPQPPLSGGKIEDQVVVVYTKPEDLYKVKENLEKNNIKMNDIGFEWRAKNTIKIDDEKINMRIEKLFEALDEQEDVNDVSSNLED
ncbi:MAG: YebC/PmpR family DNA-binding transcriptional regulator [Candidatus Pacebacteria bacterium]|nr:YebC/PmpR family DNA-binding transcriptional regulator [Candidatus Paceibacterota bacterium]